MSPSQIARRLSVIADEAAGARRRLLRGEPATDPRLMPQERLAVARLIDAIERELKQRAILAQRMK